MHVPYPFNGKVINKADFSVRAWNDQKGIHTIRGHSTSDWYREDVDYIEDTYGVWWKISAASGFGIAVVETNGRITGAVRRAFVHELQFIMDATAWSGNRNTG